MISIKEARSKNVVGSTSLHIRFEYNPTIISAIKDIGECYWDARGSFWELPISKLSQCIDELCLLDDVEFEALAEETDNLELTLDYKSKPFDYQKEGIKWLINRKNGLLCDCPGLGKTLQIIYAAEELKAQKGIEHCLIICAINSLKENWEKEIKRHSNESCVIIGKQFNSKGRVKYASIPDRADQLFNKIDEFFVIVNIESIRDKLVTQAILDSKNKFDMIVLDECHKLANPTSLQSKQFMKLSKVGQYHFGLTGTLLTNTIFNAYIPLKFINEEHACFSKFKAFYGRYEFVFGHNEFRGYRNVDVLKEQLADCSLRRDKSILNLPPKVIVPEFVEMDHTQYRFYKDLEDGIIQDADRVNIKATSILGMVTRLRQAATCPSVLSSVITSSAKIERAIELVDDIISNNEKVVIFSSFKDPLKILEDRLSHYNPLVGTGDISDAQLSESIDLFQNDNIHNVFLATSQRCGTGLTLNRATYAIFLDSNWTPALETQAEDRLHRVGTKSTVIIYKLIAKDTIDERIQKILETKQAVSDYVIDDKETTIEELRMLIGLEKS